MARAENEKNGHKLMLMVLRCKNTTERITLAFGTLRRADCDHLRMGLAWALTMGYVQKGTTNASARAWSRGGCDELFYLTKAGKAYLRSFGHDFGSGVVYQETLEGTKRRATALQFMKPAANSDAIGVQVSFLDWAGV